jgi:transposase
MNKYTKQFKREVIQYYLSGKGGYHRTAEHFGITAPMIRRWVATYRLHGEESFRQRQGHYDVNFKMSVLRHMWDNALSVNQTAAFFNIPNPTSIRIWANRYDQGGSEALNRKTTALIASTMSAPTSKPENKPEQEMTREDLLKRVKYLEMEVAVLKKLEALTQAKKAAALKKRK